RIPQRSRVIGGLSFDALEDILRRTFLRPFSLWRFWDVSRRKPDPLFQRFECRRLPPFEGWLRRAAVCAGGHQQKGAAERLFGLDLAQHCRQVLLRRFAAQWRIAEHLRQLELTAAARSMA